MRTPRFVARSQRVQLFGTGAYGMPSFSPYEGMGAELPPYDLGQYGAVR